MKQSTPEPGPGSGWQDALRAEWERRAAAGDTAGSGNPFPLAARTYGAEEIVAMAEVLLSGQLTKAQNVLDFEAAFAKWVGSPYAVMVNSGSSANLLALSAMTEKGLEPGHSEVLVPAVCWSTSLWPIVQLNLRPVLVDCDPGTLNISVEDVKAKITSRTKALVLVHTLGNCAPMDELMDLCKANGILVLEDTCESLGSTFQGKTLGTFGVFGTYSFYFSHHITTGEGGMVVANSLEDYDLLKSMRAHGWSREASNKAALEAAHPDVDPRFLFIRPGYNFRPMEVQAAMGLVQLAKATAFNANRVANWTLLCRHLRQHPAWAQQFRIIEATPGAAPVWFGFCGLLHQRHAHQHQDFLAYLTGKGVENRPIISGNFARQPALRTILPDMRPEDYPGAEIIGTRGFFVGAHVELWTDAQASQLADTMLSYQWQARSTVLVTGAFGLTGRAIQALVAEGKADLGPEAGDPAHVKWVFLGRKDADLQNLQAVRSCFAKHSPTHVVHVAAALRSSAGFAKAPVDSWMENHSINQNVLQAAHEIGVDRLVACLSTMALPAGVSYPATEADFHAGEPPKGVAGYAYSKRILDAMIKFYRDQYGHRWTSVNATNIFGPWGSFRTKGPLVEACISKALIAIEQGTKVPMFGTGKAERQFVFSKDLARILLWAVVHHDDAETVNAAGEELSVKHVVNSTVGLLGMTPEQVDWDVSMGDGVLRRTVSDAKLRAAFPEYVPTPFAEALKETVQWFKDNKPGSKQ